MNRFRLPALRNPHPARHTVSRAVLALLLLLGLIPLATPATTADALTVSIGDVTVDPREAEAWEELFATELEKLDNVTNEDDSSPEDADHESADDEPAAPDKDDDPEGDHEQSPDALEDDSPQTAAPSSAAGKNDLHNGVMIMLHFKDEQMQTIDFASYQAPLTNEGDYLIAQTTRDDTSFTYQDAVQFAVYDSYASFDNNQKDITTQCAYDPQNGTVRIPRAAVEDVRALAIVFWLSPLHPAYQHYVLNQLDTRDVSISRCGQTAVLESDIPDMLAAVRGETAPAPSVRAPLKRLAPGLPGANGKHYQLNLSTRLENFTIANNENREKQAAFGFPSSMVGSYGFGVFFGSHQTFENDVPTETTWDQPVLWPAAGSYNKVVDTFLSDTIAGRLGSQAVFAISCHGNEYRDRYVTTGRSFQTTDDQAEEDIIKIEQAPDNKAMAHGTCGTPNRVNGKGAIAMNNVGDNYIVYRGIYTGRQSEYTGWYEFFYKFDAESASTGQSFQNVVGYVLVPPAHTGSVQTRKASSAPDITNASSQYSLQDAVIAVYSNEDQAQTASDKAAKHPWDTWQEARDWAQENADFVLITKAYGKSDIVEDVPVGPYYAVELFPPPGFHLSSEVEAITVELRSEGFPNTINIVNKPELGSIDLVKVSSNPEVDTNNPCYSLAGAVYSVYTDKACKRKYADMPLVLTDDGQATAHLDNVPLGEYWIRETTRPAKGFALDRTVYPLTVTNSKDASNNTLTVKDTPKLAQIPIMVQKFDRHTIYPAPQGGASLGNAHFHINYYAIENASEEAVATLSPTASWMVRTDDRGAFLPGSGEGSFYHFSSRGPMQDLPYQISGSGFFELSNGLIGMPIGTYTIQEVKAPEGYLLDDTVHVRHINDKDSDAEALTTFHLAEADDQITDAVVRSDVQFVKRANGSVRLAGIPFKLTSKTTGEWHIIVTDSNGFATTESKATRLHTNRTNSNDAQFRQDDGSFILPDTINLEALDADAGVWFNGTKPNAEGAPVDDSQGALPYDLYELEELRCPANALFSLIRDEIIVDTSDHGSVIDLGTLNNTVEGSPSIHTEAYNGDTGNLSDHTLEADDDALVIDRVSFSGLTPGQEYQLEAILMDRATGKPLLDGDEEVRGSVAFTPLAADGFANVPLSFDASSMAEGSQVVVFETLLLGGQEKASHRNLDDVKQTLTVQSSSVENPVDNNPAPVPGDDENRELPGPSASGENETVAPKEPGSKETDSDHADSQESKTKTPEKDKGSNTDDSKKSKEEKKKDAKDEKDKKTNSDKESATTKTSGKITSEHIPLAQTGDRAASLAWAAGVVVLGSALVLALVLGWRYRRR